MGLIDKDVVVYDTELEPKVKGEGECVGEQRRTTWTLSIRGRHTEVTDFISKVIGMKWHEKGRSVGALGGDQTTGGEKMRGDPGSCPRGEAREGTGCDRGYSREGSCDLLEPMK